MARKGMTGLQPMEGTEGVGQAVAQPAKPRGREPKATVKLSVEIPHELDFRLIAVSKYAKMRKGDFVRKLIEQGCSGYKIDKQLKSVWAETLGQDVSPGQS